MRISPISIIVVAVALATILIALSACGKQPDAPERKPEASRVLAEFTAGSMAVIEFRDNAGRICVAAGITGNRSNSVALDCDRLAPLDYEVLEMLIERRPL